ncbi:MAG: DUF983 domain-containing protein [Bacteroidota bacterium]
MNNGCSHCGMDFRQEPGFYFGAAYVSYGLQVAFMLLLYVIFQVFIELRFWVFVGLLAGLMLVLVPLFFRLSRLIWLNLTGRQD